MRLDYLQRQRQWEAEQAREAPMIPSDPPEEEEPPSSAMPISAPSTQQLWADDEIEVEEVVQREDEELAALLEYMSDDGEDGEGEVESEHVWSDDDYDALFSEYMERDGEVVGEQHHLPAELPHTNVQGSGEAMDVS